MTKIRFGTALIGIVIALTAAQQASALCGSGRRELTLQHSDIRLEPGVLTYLPLRVMTVGLPIPAGAFPSDCGLSAKSELPGLNVISGYGITPPVTNPPGVWTPIGIAGNTTAGWEPWRELKGGTAEFFAILFDPTDPTAAKPGTQGRIVIAVDEGSDTGAIMRPIGVINIHIGFASRSTPTWFTVTSSAANIVENRISLDHPLLNGNPRAKLLVSHLINPPGLTPRNWNHPLVAGYNTLINKWTIANADRALMPAGLGFNVRIDASALQVSTGHPDTHPPSPFVQINDPIANNNPYATIVVSMTGSQATNPHPVAVEYTGSRWRIVNSDNALIPAGVMFNVKVIGFSAYHKETLDHRQDLFASNSAGISVRDITRPPIVEAFGRLLHFWWAGGNRSEPMLVTANRTPMGISAPTPGRYVGLKYVEGIRPRWSLFYEDGSVIPANAAFNVLAEPQQLFR
jgi:hypothetical protein